VVVTFFAAFHDAIAARDGPASLVSGRAVTSNTTAELGRTQRTRIAAAVATLVCGSARVACLELTGSIAAGSATVANVALFQTFHEAVAADGCRTRLARVWTLEASLEHTSAAAAVGWIDIAVVAGLLRFDYGVTTNAAMTAKAGARPTALDGAHRAAAVARQ
jgi:hypothetical protein